MKKNSLIILSVLLVTVGAQAQQTFDAAASGNWTDTSSWQQAEYPGAIVGQNDAAYIYNAHTITLDSALPEELDNMAMWGNGHLIMNDGASLGVNSGFLQMASGTLDLNSGAEITHTGSQFLYIGQGEAGGVATLNINGGTFNSTQPSFLGLSTSNGVTTLNVTDGLFTSTAQLLMRPGANTEANVNVTGGTLQFDFIDFGDVDNGSTETITVDGGNFILTTGNEAGSLGFKLAPASQKVIYESGLMVWAGVADLAEFNAFKSGAYTDALNAGYLVTTSGYTNTDFLDGLTYVDGTGAVLAIPEISSASALMGLAMGMIVFITRRKRSH